MTKRMKPDTCGCCEPTTPTVPLQIENRPALSAVVYRIGTYTSFRRSLFEAIAGTPELTALKTRLSDDYAITLFELWSTVADVLTFYQERILNEGFLRTARFRDSVIRMTRLIDYQLGPGAAATVALAFSVEQDKQVKIPVGLRLQSVPGQDEKPQKFETVEAIDADARWNRLCIVPKPVAINAPSFESATEAYLAPGNTALAVVEELAPGDRLVRFNPDTADPIEELEVEEIRVERDRVILAWSPPIESTTLSPTSPVYKLGRRFRLFGYNAPTTYMKSSHDPKVAGNIKWEHKEMVDVNNNEYLYNDADLLLDGRYEEIAVGCQLLVSVDGGVNTLVTVTEVGQVHAELGSINDTVTRLKVTPGLSLNVDRREVLIYELVGPEISFWGHIFPGSFKLGSVYIPGRRISSQHIEVGRSLAKGVYQEGDEIDLEEIELDRRVLLQDARQTVAATIKSVSFDGPIGGEDYLRLDLETDFEGTLKTSSSVLLGNVAQASHGETVKEEILGDAEGTTVFQQFDLKKMPLTYVPNAAHGGLESTLKLLVNRVLWQQERSFYGKTSTDQVYTTRIADDGTVTVQLGDGVTGALPFSGRGNVMAFYRHGTGLDGRVPANALTTLLDRPVGLKSVTNLRGAEGGADPETLEDARSNAPTTVRTFGRAVSLRDFEDLAMITGEVAKARATWVWSGEGRVVHLTVAGQLAAIFSTETLSRIHASFTAQRDPNHTLLIDNFVRVPLVIGATLNIAPTHIATDVENAARLALEAALSFETLRFGQQVHLSDVYQVLQEVDGMVWLKIDLFQFKDQSDASRCADDRPVQEHLRIYPARPAPGPPAAVLPAEQAWIEAPTQDITLLTSGGLPV